MKGKAKKEVSANGDEIVTSNFDLGSEDDFNVICNVVSVLPREYVYVTEVTEPVDCDEEVMANHKPMCYFVMNNGCIEEKNVFFERPCEGMKSHLKPLFIAKVEIQLLIRFWLIEGLQSI